MDTVDFTRTTCAERGGKCVLICAFVAILISFFSIIVYRIVKESKREAILLPQIVEEVGLAQLGIVDKNGNISNFVLSSLQYTHKAEQGSHKMVLLHPTSSSVRGNFVKEALSPEAKANGIELRLAPSLEESVFTLFNAEDADAVIVVVEEGVSTVSEVEEIVHEFREARILLAGFVYVSR